MTYLKNLIILMRPREWIKNIFVFTGIVFSHNWSNIPLVTSAILAAISFCLISSSIYVFNDILDIKKDRNHPRKKLRPLATGTVSPTEAGLLSLILGIAGLLLGYFITPKLFLILICYALLNIAYSLKLKHVVILDVFCISLGFMLRILAGTVGLGIPPSKWLVLCGMMVTLYLGFTKRRSELTAQTSHADNYREVLKNYGKTLLDELIVISATGTIITYSLYTMSDETIKLHQTDALIYTVPFVIYGIFRYIYLLNQGNVGTDPSREIFQDHHILASISCWMIATFYLMSNH